jgi:hypothetical protein
MSRPEDLREAPRDTHSDPTPVAPTDVVPPAVDPALLTLLVLDLCECTALAARVLASHLATPPRRTGPTPLLVLARRLEGTTARLLMTLGPDGTGTPTPPRGPRA